MLDRPNHDCHQAFYPNDLNSLKSVFDVLCREVAVLPDAEGAQELAAELVRLYQTGMTDETALKSALRPQYQATMRRE